MTTDRELKNMCESIAKDLNDIYEGVYPELNEDGEPVTMWDYFNDVLDIEYTIGSGKDYRGVRLMVAFGGPNIYVDTRDRKVQGYWGTNTTAAWIPSEICAEIDDIFEEYYDCI